ncbi:protealysin inhibitor emfourin [Spirosoma flavum]|uniref:Protealysin inhibitor emfourin n=1 Tax=Spirosoma flavum TaxID=2048557 RepID=A0ABW6APP8_9BACT
MKLTYSREGGLFPQIAQAEVESSDLPADLQKLAGTVLANPESYTSRSATRDMRDGYQYRLDLQEGSKNVSLAFDDLNIPDDVQPLIYFLQKRTGKP